ncbi:MAG: Asp-tRNA(Asn)/Glu-tRNA(Gln) amidotransferase subunit GatB [Gammaproteobacteria bacterium]|nr:Asp-tRNA(Asn)/Glu-tRNA(Gln) amidotransferase subunit GatB [Gammaproteobacteria bacterium]
MYSNWETVIGLEIHAQLSTNSKLFSGSSIAYGAEPNTQANEVDLALPGTLPVLNKEVMNLATRLGIALNATINKRSVFERKNYFYPDLPKGYQTSQLELPIVEHGELFINVNGEEKRVGVTRAHLEEDAGKSIHGAAEGCTGIDLNRAGTPLLEIVSEPELSSAAEAVAYMKKLHSLVQYIGICDGNMQEGSFRCDANVSVRSKGQEELGTRAEIKNINSFRFVEKAINFEIERQIDLIEDGGEVVQETRLYDADKNETRSMRSKEEANDYRYFPCPDLLPVVIDDAFIEAVRGDMPELPDAKKARFVGDFGLSDEDAAQLTNSRPMADYFEAVVADGIDPKMAANWCNGELAAWLNKEEKDVTESPVSAEMLAGMCKRIADNTISNKIAKEVFEGMWNGEGDADAVIEVKGLKQITDTGAIEAMIDEIIASNAGQVEQYRAGKEKVFGFFVGQVMKATQGKANPAQVNQILKQKLTG